jgi:hypothetical protein
MEKRFNIMVIGAGTIGGEIISRLKGAPEWNLSCVVRNKTYTFGAFGDMQAAREFDPASDSQFRNILKEEKPHVAFLAIPTRDHGKIALRYMLDLLQSGAKVVTAEKGVAAWQFEHIAEHLNHIDLGAAVGGGNAFIYTLRRRHLRGKRVTMYAVLNATMNRILSDVQSGMSLVKSCKEVSGIGYAEPLKPGESPNPLTIFNGELVDVIMKICAFFNMVLSKGEYINPDRFQSRTIDESDLRRLVSPNDRRRFVITITNDPGDIDDDDTLIAPLRLKIDGFYIDAGFKSIRAGTFLSKWLPEGIDNGVLWYENDDVYMASGPGAGPATVDVMMAGAKELLRLE